MTSKKKSRMEVLTELPKYEKGTYKGKTNWKQTIGMTIEVEHEDYGKVSFKVLDYKTNDQRLFLEYDGYISKDGIKTGGFLNGNFGTIMNVSDSSKNVFRLDENNILHIYGENKGVKWEAIYSGEHTKEVMNTSWYVGENKILTSNYNFKGECKSLHRIDINPKSNMVIDHIGNPYQLIDKFYDNRVDNLRKVTRAENTRNKKCKNKWGYTGLIKYKKGWYSQFNYSRTPITINTKHDFNEAILDNLIAQRYLGYKHQEEEFWKLDDLSEDRIREVTDLLDEKMKNADNKIHKIRDYEYDIEEKDGYYILKKNSHEMLFDCDLGFIKDKNICPLIKSNGVYWSIRYINDNKKIQNYFHRYTLGFKPNEYEEYKIYTDHLNNNPSDNRLGNLVITTAYSNLCNIMGVGYRQIKLDSYIVDFMAKYKFWDLIGGVKMPTFKTEEEAINEVERRKSIIESARVKLKTKAELNELIKYCLDNGYIKENGLADLDLGHLYWKGILKNKDMAS